MNKQSVIFFIVIVIIAFCAGWFLIREVQKTEDDAIALLEQTSSVVRDTEKSPETQKEDKEDEELVWYEVPEMQMKMHLPKSIAEDLVYNYFQYPFSDDSVENVQRINISFRSLAAFKYCAFVEGESDVNKDDGSQKAIVLYKGEPKDYFSDLQSSTVRRSLEAFESHIIYRTNKFFLRVAGPSDLCLHPSDETPERRKAVLDILKRLSLFSQEDFWRENVIFSPQM